jgi:hypothetical protein
MPLHVPIAKVTPAPRFPPLVDPWTRAVSEESATPDALSGPVIETIDPLVPAATPLTDPPTYNFSTDAATLPDGWVRVVFLDALGNEGPTEWVSADGRRVALPPAPNQIRLRSELLQKRYPEDPFDADVEAALGDTVEDATVLVESLTCRTLDNALAQDRQLGRLALRAVILKAEQFGQRSTAKAAGGLAAGQMLRGFTAGPYSEQYFGPDEAAKAKLLDPNPTLHEVLWALATEECRENWIALWTGEHPPAAMIQTFDWQRSRYARPRSY